MGSSIAPEIFREYDIRGIVGETLTPQAMRAIGRAYGTYIQTQTGPRIVTGRDLRASSEDLQASLIEGLVASGCEVTDVGPAPTPVVYFAAGKWEADGAVIVTASHNPVQYNGVKSRRHDQPLFGAELRRIKAVADDASYRHGLGCVEERDVFPEYLECIKGKFSLGEGPKVVIDCGNGAAALTAVEILSAIGCQVTELYCTPDGTLAREPDPTKQGALDDLKAKVIEAGADVGVAFDPDGDRLAVLDHTGEAHAADLAVIPMCRQVLAEAPGTVVSEVRVSQTLIDDVKDHGGGFEMTACGYPHIVAGMARTNGVVGTETSGHVYFGDPDIKFDDAVYAACRLAEALVRAGSPLRDILASAPQYASTPEERWHCEEALKFKVVERAVDHFLARGVEALTIDGIRVQYDDGWGLIRASNTGPELVMRFEGKTEEACNRIRSEMQGVLRDVMAHLG